MPASAELAGTFSSCDFNSQRLFAPPWTAPGSVAVPVLLGPAAVPAPEVLASPRGDGLVLAPVVLGFTVPAPSLIAPCDAPGPTLPWLDAPSEGWLVCANAAGEASAKMQADAKMIFFIQFSLGFALSTRENRC